MKSICLIIPYFGKFPNYFDLWLKSVKYNKDINFLILTDDYTNYDFPGNVKIVYTTFEKLKEKIQKLFDFKINLKYPYKLCDFKPAYGEIFRDEIRDYDFWGYCDIDLLFGDITKYITKDILDRYDKINMHGHFSLYRNNEEMNNLYKYQHKKLVDYKFVFRRNWIYHFDEYPGISFFCEYAGIKTIDIENYADINWLEYKFLKYYDHTKRKNDDINIEQIFCWNKGKVYSLVLEENSVNYEEFMYVHLQKRQMEKYINSSSEKYYIVPNKFIKIDSLQLKEKIKEYSKNLPYIKKDEFKKECLRNRFKIEYWMMKIKMHRKRWK